MSHFLLIKHNQNMDIIDHLKEENLHIATKEPISIDESKPFSPTMKTSDGIIKCGQYKDNIGKNTVPSNTVKHFLQNVPDNDASIIKLDVDPNNLIKLMLRCRML